jgi:hypothetical protein
MLMAFSLLFASLTSSSTANDVGNLSMDDIYRKKIIGKWSEGESPYGISSFEAGGIYRAWMYDNARKEKLLHTMKGKWWIEKGKLYNTISEITPPIPGLKAGDVVIDRIVDITDDVMTLIEEDGRQYTNKKVKE